MGKIDAVLHTYMSKPERIKSVLEYYTKEKLPDNWIVLCKILAWSYETGGFS